MGLNKSKGNMYPWVTHTHSHLMGACPHACSYCYAQKYPATLSGKYVGPVRLLEKELEVNYGTGKTIFVEHMNDLFAAEVPFPMIDAVLEHCKKYQENEFVFQTKNPNRAFAFWGDFPRKYMIGTTIESNRDYPEITKAPSPGRRIDGIRNFSFNGRKSFITIEPILDFDVKELVDMIISAYPQFVNIGADSKGSGLPEPPREKVMALSALLISNSITIRKKDNLDRILEKGDLK